MTASAAPPAVLVTFGDGDLRYRRAAARLVREAHSLDLYKQVVALDLTWLRRSDPEISRLVHHWIDYGNLRGVGYWAWKSSAMLWAAREFPGCLVHYLDAGHTIESNARARSNLHDWLVEAQDEGELAWSIPGCSEVAWNKIELRRLLDPSDRFGETDQVEAGFVVLRSDRVGPYASELRRLCLHDQGFLISDEILEQQDRRFVAHRNDQSLHSLLWKLHARHYRESQTLATCVSGVEAARHASGFPRSGDGMTKLLTSLEFLSGRVEKALRITHGQIRPRLRDARGD